MTSPRDIPSRVSAAGIDSPPLSVPANEANPMKEPMHELLAALNKVMASVGYVQKDKKNAFHGYKYAGEEALLTVLRPALVENGLILIPSLDGAPAMDEHGNTNLTMAYTLAHVSGAVWPEKIRVPGCGNDRAKNGTMGDKGAYKALTGANKYMLFKLFQIATGDDPEVESEHDKSSETEAPAPKPARGNGITKLKGELRAFAEEMRTAPNLEAFEQLVAGGHAIIAECQEKLPGWYHGDGSDIEGLAKTIERRRAELKPNSTGTRKGTFDPHTPYGADPSAPPF